MNTGLVRSKQRVSDHGEVFTPGWLVDDMLDLVDHESRRIDARVLEPACGSGNFLTRVLRRKLQTVESTYGSSPFERRHHALLGLMCIYGIELLEDNARQCRRELLAVFVDFLGAEAGPDWLRAAETVLEANIVQGDAIAMKTASGAALTFPEWGYLGKGRYQRRDFRYDALTQRASFEGTLFEALDESDLFTPSTVYPAMRVSEIGP